MSSLARNTLFLTGAKFLGTSIYAMFGFILPRYVSLEINGVYTLMGALLFLGSMISSFGIPLIVTREVARDPNRSARLYADGRLAMWLGTLAAALVLGGFLVIESLYTGDPLNQRLILFLLVMGITLADAMGSLGEALFQGHERMAMPAMVEILTGLFRAGGATLALVFLPEEQRLYGIFVMFLVGSSIRGWLLPRLVHQRLLPGETLPKSTPRRAWDLLKSSGFVAIFRILRMLRNRIDVLLMGFLFVSLIPGVFGEVDMARGMYGQAMRVAVVFQTFTMAFNTALFPRLARLTESTMGSDTKAATRALYGRAVRWQAFWVVPMAAGIFLYSDIVCGWFGPEYRFGAPDMGVLHSTAEVLRVLLVAMVVDCLGGPVGLLMLGSKELEKRIPAVGVTILVSSVVFNIILIPRYGILGAAYASAITACLEFLIKMTLVGRMFGNPLPILVRTVPYYGLTAAMIGLLFLVNLEERVFLGAAVGVAFYGVACLGLKQVDPAVVSILKRKLGRA